MSAVTPLPRRTQTRHGPTLEMGFTVFAIEDAAPCEVVRG